MVECEEEKEQLWVNKLDLQKRFILGRAYNVRNEKEEEIFLKGLEEAQKENRRLGYGDDSEEFKTIKYNITLKMLRNNNKRHEINSKYLKSK